MSWPKFFKPAYLSWVVSMFSHSNEPELIQHLFYIVIVMFWAFSGVVTSDWYNQSSSVFCNYMRIHCTEHNQYYIQPFLCPIWYKYSCIESCAASTATFFHFIIPLSSGRCNFLFSFNKLIEISPKLDSEIYLDLSLDNHYVWSMPHTYSPVTSLRCHK